MRPDRYFSAPGVAAFFDETVFHQLLHWHHCYDPSTTEVGLVSDGRTAMTTPRPAARWT